MALTEDELKDLNELATLKEKFGDLVLQCAKDRVGTPGAVTFTLIMLAIEISRSQGCGHETCTRLMMREFLESALNLEFADDPEDDSKSDTTKASDKPCPDSRLN